MPQLFQRTKTTYVLLRIAQTIPWLPALSQTKHDKSHEKS